MHILLEEKGPFKWLQNRIIRSEHRNHYRFIFRSYFLDNLVLESNLKKKFFFSFLTYESISRPHFPGVFSPPLTRCQPCFCLCPPRISSHIPNLLSEGSALLSFARSPKFDPRLLPSWPDFSI